MKKTLRKHCNTHRLLTKNHSIPQGFKLSPLIHSIRKLITLGGLTIASAGVWAEAQINPHEIWLNSGSLRGLCAQDIDQDGDMDLFKISLGVVTMLENIGTSESPEFSPPLPFANNTGSLKLNRLGLSDCRYYDNSSVSIDIDADGDLDLFTASFDKYGGGGLEYAQNDGTTEQPLYVIENNHDLFGLPNISSSFFFRDIDNDGDEDFFHNYPATFYENIGTPENAQFVDRMEHPLQPFCNDDLGFLVDLNNDTQWDAICLNYQNNTFELIESSVSGYLPARNLFNANLTTFLNDVQAIDIDKDGDMDIISAGYSELVVYTNIGSSLLPQFDSGNSYPNTSAGFSVLHQIFSDLDGDDDLDYISLNSGSRLIYAHNKGSNISPAFEVSTLSPELIQCNNSFYEIADANRTDLSNISHFSILDIALVDIDGDNDLDLFSQLKLSETNVTPGPNANANVSVYCENQGSVTNPLFTSGLINPFGLNSESSSIGQISFGDIDGDNDQDAWIGSRFYDNIGDSNEALFRHISHLPFSSDFSSLVDIDGDGQIDSVLEHSNSLRLLYKGLEPATNIAAIALQYDLVLATSRASQIQLQRCNPIEGFCGETLVLPSTAQELSLSTGDFNGNGQQDIVLAMIDAGGNLKIELFDLNLHLIGSAEGDSAHSISVSAGQLDDDPADEYVVSFVQPDNRVAAITFNLDGSQVGKAETNPGKQPSVAVGKFDGINDAYVLAYTTLENNLQTSVHRGDGTQLSQTFGELSSQVFVSAADISPSKPGNEYVVAMIRASGLAGLNGFAADSTFLGEVTGDIAEQPKVVSGHFPSLNDSGLAASLIQQDNKPVLIFLDNQGRHLATAVGGTTASVSTHVLFDIDGDGIDEGILVYIDEAGIPRWEVFGADGVKK